MTEKNTDALAGAAAALKGLKDFQRETVEYVFEQLYLPGSSGRFLVADEVGLGKTLIARGVVAKTIEHLRTRVERTDIVYVCSNADIARQNINRLRIEGEHLTLASRLTLLPRYAEQLRKSPSHLNFISFTPATSFDLSGGLGHVQERLLLLALLREVWGLGSSTTAMNVFRGSVDSDKFRAQARCIDLKDFDPEGQSTKDFRDELERRSKAAHARGVPDLRARFDDLCEAYKTSRSHPEAAISKERSRFIGELRAALAASCVRTLEPDLVILDEFQRFSHLLDGEDEASELARSLFEFPDVRVLMLSATPYKMYTTADESGGEDHYQDFARTLRFLEGPAAPGDDFEKRLEEYREGLLELGNPERRRSLDHARKEIEQRLRRVMVRTERLASTPDRNGMLKEIASSPARLTPQDALGYVSLQKLAHLCGQPDVLEYWKSGPYVLNFMDEDYQLKRKLLNQSDEAGQRFTLAKMLTAEGNHQLPWSEIERYAEIDPGNARMRALMEQTVGRGLHRLLWLAPSLPYYRLRGPWAEPGARDLTKRLIFSSWRFAPRAIAALLSYEAERRMLGRAGDGANSAEERRRRRRSLLRFGIAEGRHTGMPVLALLYPSVFLARACDPVRFAAECFRDGAAGEGFADPEEVLAAARTQIEIALRRLPAGAEDGRIDERWYWVAPLLLDRMTAEEATGRWFAQAELPSMWAGEDLGAEEEDGAWTEHVEQACRFARGEGEPLGRRPDDLVQVLAEMALAAPGVTLLRSMLRVVGLRTDQLSDEAGLRIRNAAGVAAFGFRALFNRAEVAELLNREMAPDAELPYWRIVLRYCLDGCLQAVLDEYAHVLRDHLGLSTGTAGERIHEIAEQIAQSLSLRTASLTTWDVQPSESGRTVRQEARRMRCHFALRFGDERSDDGTLATRADSVRTAFNSPFWPFVVATTSVGQEGLDFHTYCHAVVHWNLPSNPVDLEQREGRVHRYKGHAVRKNIARTHGLEALRHPDADIWETMFEQARRSRGPDKTDIVPYWVYSIEGGARIERHVLALPLSREFEQMSRLSKSLAVYRMVFGQPRQDDLLRFLLQTMPAEELEKALASTRIDLSPTGPLPAGSTTPTAA